MDLVRTHTVVAIADLLLIMMLSQAHHGIEVAEVVVLQEKEMMAIEIEKDLLIIEAPAEDHHQVSPVEKDSLAVSE